MARGSIDDYLPLGKGRAGVFSLDLNTARNSLGGVCPARPPARKPRLRTECDACSPGGLAGERRCGRHEVVARLTAHRSHVPLCGRPSQSAMLCAWIPPLGSTPPSISVSTLVSVRQCGPPYCAQTTPRELGHPGCTFE